MNIPKYISSSAQSVCCYLHVCALRADHWVLDSRLGAISPGLSLFSSLSRVEENVPFHTSMPTDVIIVEVSFRQPRC